MGRDEDVQDVDGDGRGSGPADRHGGSLRSVALAGGIGAAVLAAGYVLSYQSLVGAQSAGQCIGIGFGCRPSPALTVGFAVAVTAPPWLVVLAAAGWAARRRGGRLAALLTWGSVVVAVGSALWMGAAVA